MSIKTSGYIADTSEDLFEERERDSDTTYNEIGQTKSTSKLHLAFAWIEDTQR